MTTEMCTRFLGQQIVEDMFNRVKKEKDKGSNTVTTPQSAWAICVDKKVVGGIHKFDEVDRGQEQPTRNTTFDASVFSAPLRLDKIHPSLKELGVHKVVGTNAPDWYHPGATNIYQSEADIFAKRECKKKGDLKL